MSKGNAVCRMAASALSLVLVISMIISALLLSLVFLYSNRQAQLLHYRRTAEVQRNTRSGIAYLLGNASLPYFQHVSLDLYSQGNDSVKLEKRPWGLFDLMVACATKSGSHDSLVAMVGSHFSAPGLAALYVADNNKPLSLVGASQVVGDCYLPGPGIRPGYLNANDRHQPKVLATGRIRTSAATLPLSIDSVLSCLRDFSLVKLAAWLPHDAQAISTLKSTNRSFYRSPLVWYQTQPATIKNVVLTGQIILVNTHKITIEPDASLDNVLVIAPVVVVKRGFQGRLQVFAQDTVEVQADCQLTYPSALCAYNTQGSAKILLGERSRIMGLLLAATSPGGAVPSLVRMHENTRVDGQLYTDGFLENCGQIIGTVMCRRLIYSTVTSFYENYLVNAIIDRNQLPVDFLSTKLLNPAGGLGILAWLY